MRKILYAMKETWKDVLAQDQGAPPARLAEVDDLFSVLDQELNGIRKFGTNSRLQEVMISADFTYAIQEFVQRMALPTYQEKVFAFEPLMKMDTLPNYLPVSRYQLRDGVDDLEYVGEKG
jgi:hypothetical protein